MKLKGKVVVITGTAMGLGRATAIASAREGAQLILADIDEAGGQETAKTIERHGGSAHFVRTDMSKAAHVEKLMNAVENRHGHLDILINPAAILLDPNTRIDEFSEESWKRVIEVNLTGSFFAVKYAVPLLEKAGGGVILLLISGAGVTGGSSSVPYAASKGGVRGLALMLETQLEPLNIRIHAVSPPDMATNMKLGAIREMAEKEGQSGDVAEENARQGLEEPAETAKVLVDLASDAGATARGRVTVFHSDWDLETRTLRNPNRPLR